MRHTHQSFLFLVSSLIITTGCLYGGVKLQVRDGRPIADGVYVNGHGPYRFLLDTGSNINLIETGIARKIGMKATFQVDLASAAGTVPASGSDENEIALESAKADHQKFLYSDLNAIHHSFPDVQGVLGQWYLARFDYTLDLKGKRLEFGKQDRSGARTPLKMINARPVVLTSLGALALDSGIARLTLFGFKPDAAAGFAGEMRTVAGSRQVGRVWGKPLVIEGRKIWDGEAVAIPNRAEPGVDGLLPLNLLKAVYFCNSEGYVILD